MEVLTLADLCSGLGAAVNAHVHARKGAAREAAYNVVCSMAGRFTSKWLSGGVIDTVTLSMLSPGAKNQLVVYLARYLIARGMNEQQAMVKGFDAVLADLLGEELSSIITQTNLLAGIGMGAVTAARTGGVAGANAAPATNPWAG